LSGGARVAVPESQAGTFGELQGVGLKRGRPLCLLADPIRGQGAPLRLRAVAGVRCSHLCGERPDRGHGHRSERQRDGRNPARISCALGTGSQPSEIGVDRNAPRKLPVPSDSHTPQARDPIQRRSCLAWRLSIPIEPHPGCTAGPAVTTSSPFSPAPAPSVEGPSIATTHRPSTHGLGSSGS